MKSITRICIGVGITAVVVIVGIVTFWAEKSAREKLINANPPIERLLFVKKAGEEFALEQSQKIEEFKTKLLARAGLGVKLTDKEREIFNVVISDRGAMFPNGEMVVNQSVLKFNAEEINLISNALKK